MVDATNMYPLGFHPVRDRFLNDVSTPTTVIPRSELGVKNYFVDFGISSYFPSGRNHKQGWCWEPRDAIRMCQNYQMKYFMIHPRWTYSQLAMFFDNFLYEVCQSTLLKFLMLIDIPRNIPIVIFFAPLIGSMMQSNPADRPSAVQALRHWRSIRRRLTFLDRWWMPRERKLSFSDLIVSDIIHFFSLIGHTIWALGRRLRRFVV